MLPTRLAILRLLGRLPTLSLFLFLGCQAAETALGPESEAPRFAAAAGAADRGFGSVSAGTFHTCGVDTSGAAFCWGDNSGGKLGDGTTTPSSNTPVAVSGGLTFAAVSAGGNHTCGLTTSGAVHCWGRNREGQLGDATNTQRNTPVAVRAGRIYVSADGGFVYTCGLTRNAQAFCWGRNASGELGNGTNVDANTPRPVRF